MILYLRLRNLTPTFEIILSFQMMVSFVRCPGTYTSIKEAILGGETTQLACMRYAVTQAKACSTR